MFIYINISINYNLNYLKTIKIEDEVWKETKKFCIDKEITPSNLIETLLKKELKIKK